MASLAGKVVIVTGASSGVGRKAALRFAAGGASVVLSGRDEARLAAVAGLIGDEGVTASVTGDVGEEATAEALVSTALDRFGRLDRAFNAAGELLGPHSLRALTLEDWRRTLDSNLTSAFLALRHQAPAMAEHGGGSIVFASSLYGNAIGAEGAAAYSAAKAGVGGLVRVGAVEFAGDGVRVNEIVLGAIDTPGNAANWPGAEPAVRDHMAKLSAMGRLGRAAEAVAAAGFLLSDDASFITGASMVVDGGLAVKR